MKGRKGQLTQPPDSSVEAVGFIGEKVLSFFFPGSSVNVTPKEPEASALSEKVTCLPWLFPETAGNFSQIPTWLFLSLYPQVQF